MAEQKDSLLAKLDQLEARYSEIEKKISEPQVASDPNRFIALSKEQGKIKTIVTKYRQYKIAEAGIEEAEQILSDSSADEDFKALAKEEIPQLEEQKNNLLEEITNTMIMADAMDIDSVVMEIRAGTGGEEAALFARDLYGMYTRYAETRRWKIEQLDFSADCATGPHPNEVFHTILGDQFGRIDRAGGNTHAGPHHRYGLALVRAGETEHVAHVGNLLDIVHEGFCDIFST